MIPLTRPLLTKTRGHYWRELAAGRITLAIYFRRIRAVERAERRAEQDQEARRALLRERVRASKAKAALRRQLQQSIAEAA